MELTIVEPSCFKEKEQVDVKVLNLIRSKFEFVGYYSDNYDKSLSFLLSAIEFHNIDVSKFHLYYYNRYYDNVFGSVSVGEDYKLRLNLNNKSEYDNEFVILHELGHIKQVNEGRLRRPQIYYTGKFLFDDKEYPHFEAYSNGVLTKEYINSPWELDANNFVFNSPLYKGDKFIKQQSLVELITETRQVLGQATCQAIRIVLGVRHGTE